MRLREFLIKIRLPIFLISIAVLIVTFLSFFLRFQITLIKDRGLLQWILHNIFYQFDLTNSGNFATWFESILFLNSSIALFLLGSGDNERFPLKSVQKYILKITAFGFLLISVDVIVSLFSQSPLIKGGTLQILNDTRTHQPDFSSVLFTLLLIIIAILILLGIVKKLIQNVKNKATKSKVRSFFLLILLALLLMLILDFVQFYYGIPESMYAIGKCFWEVIKIFTILILYYLLTELTENYKL